jgi:coenzyme A diphosphatase NUDT7
MIGYARDPTFEVQPPNAPTLEERIAHSLLTHPTFRQAYIEEGMNPELAVGGVLARIQEGKAKKENEKLVRSREPRRRGWRDGSRL